MIKRILWSVLLVAIFVGCKDDKVDSMGDEELQEQFMQQTVCGVYAGGAAIFAFDAVLHQLAFTTDGKSWRISTDSQDKYVSCKLNDMPVVNGKSIVEIKVKGINDLAAGEEEGIVLKQENNKCWFWITASSTGFLMQFSE